MSNDLVEDDVVGAAVSLRRDRHGVHHTIRPDEGLPARITGHLRRADDAGVVGGVGHARRAAERAQVNERRRTGGCDVGAKRVELAGGSLCLPDDAGIVGAERGALCTTEGSKLAIAVVGPDRGPNRRCSRCARGRRSGCRTPRYPSRPMARRRGRIPGRRKVSAPASAWERRWSAWPSARQQ